MNVPRFFVEMPLAAGAELALPPGPARHAQVLRLQPGDAITLFDGRGGQWQASIVQMRRSEVRVRVDAHEPVEREAARPVHLAVGLFAPERMDWLVEKATELGAASLTPVHTARSNLALARAGKRRDRWRAISARACEQCGRNRLLRIDAALRWPDYLQQLEHDEAQVRWLLSPSADAAPLAYHSGLLHAGNGLAVLSGPEGGLTDAEHAAAVGCRFAPVGLGARILRAETAPLAVLAALLLADPGAHATSGASTRP